MRNPQLERIGLCALLVSILLPLLNAVRRRMATDPPPTAWQITGFVASKLTLAVLLLAVVLAVMFMIAYVVDRVRLSGRGSQQESRQETKGR